MNAAIILSGGTGTRMGADIPKQYIEVEGKSIIEYSVQKFFLSRAIDIIVIVAAKYWQTYIKKIINETYQDTKHLIFAEPGDTRQLSIFNGLTRLEETHLDIDKVIIHDAARPLVSKKLIEECLSNLSDGYSGVLPVLPMKDTVYYSVDGKKIDRLLERAQLYAGQAPEAFNFSDYLNAHKKMSKAEIEKINGSSELAYTHGMRIKMIPGDFRNYKITDSEDLERFKSTIL